VVSSVSGGALAIGSGFYGEEFVIGESGSGPLSVGWVLLCPFGIFLECGCKTSFRRVLLVLKTVNQVLVRLWACRGWVV